MLSSDEVAKKKAEYASSFSIKDPEVDEIHDAHNREVLGLSDEDFVAFAHMTAKYKGEPPAEYRVLNAFVQDFVKDNYKSLEASILSPLYHFLNNEYPEADISDIEQGITDYIWEGQLDYIPMIDPDKKEIHFDLELVLAMDKLEDSDDSEEYTE